MDDNVQRIISKHQHADGLIGLWPNNQMLEDVSYDFGPNQGHGTHYDVTNRYRMGQSSLGHYMNASGYHWKTSSYTDILSADLANNSRIPNPNFETAGAGDPDFWASWGETAGDGALANEVVIVHDGTDSCKMTAGATANTLVFTPPIAFVPGTTYHIRFWTYGDGVNDGRYRIWDNVNGVYTIPMTSTGATAAAWAEVTVDFTAPAGCTLATIELCCPAANGGICYFDNCDFVYGHGFDADAGAAFVFCKTDVAWNEGSNRYALYLEDAEGDEVWMRKDTVAGRLYYRHDVGGRNLSMNVDDMDTDGWFCMAMMWDRLVNAEVRIYLDGVYVERGINPGVSSGTDLVIAQIGRETMWDSWEGGLGITALYNQIKTDDEMLKLSTP